MTAAVTLCPLLREFVEFLETGEASPDAFAPDCVGDFNVPGWRYPVEGAAALAAHRREAGPGRWTVQVDRAEPTPTGYVVELSHAHGGEYYRTLSLVTVAEGRIAEFVHYCTGNWGAEARAAYARSGGAGRQ